MIMIYHTPWSGEQELTKTCPNRKKGSLNYSTGMPASDLWWQTTETDCSQLKQNSHPWDGHQKAHRLGGVLQWDLKSIRNRAALGVGGSLWSRDGWTVIWGDYHGNHFIFADFVVVVVVVLCVIWLKIQISWAALAWLGTCSQGFGG